ncbi:hypothetical protein OIN95_15135, partial [Staphylococcus aureus]|uniref:hypothetical protein n=1 Tax=Staphylococcus aureus TaxID=1280 RepID=UPI002B1C9493
AWPVDPDAEALGRARTSVSGLIKSQEDDALLVSVLLSYLNDHLMERDKRRLAAELMTRGLSDHEDRRAAALVRVKGGSA